MDYTKAIREYIDLEKEVISKLDVDAINDAMNLIMKAYEANKKIYIFGKWGSTRNAGDAGAVESSAGAHPGDRIRSGFKNFAGEKIIGDTVEAGRAGGNLHRRNRGYPGCGGSCQNGRIFRLPRGALL